MRHRRFGVRVGVGLAVVSTALVLGSLAVVRLADDDDSAAATSGDDPAPATATVTRRDLEERVELDGSLGYGDARTVALASAGTTITALPPVGSVVDRGGTLVEVDGRAVPLLLGERPLWRLLGEAVTDGPDVEVLEANLVALGIVQPDALTVDQRWTPATTRAVKAWQRSLGWEDTGAVARGDAVVLPAAVRIVGASGARRWTGRRPGGRGDGDGSPGDRGPRSEPTEPGGRGPAG